MIDNLLERCIAAQRDGQDFRTIYDTIISPHPLRLGQLRSATDGKRIWLAVRLETGQSLIFESSKGEFRLESEAASVP